jgi:hypothetical protein
VPRNAIRTAHPGDDEEMRAVRAELHRELETTWKTGLTDKLGRLRYLTPRRRAAGAPTAAGAPALEPG